VKLLLVNGPNLNLLGTREPDIYGHETLDDIVSSVRASAQQRGCEIVDVQSNHEGEILDAIHQHAPSVDGMIINPGALTHYSIALRDAISGTGIRTVEVHLSNIHTREEFRHHSVISAVVAGTIVGFGSYGYHLALQWFTRDTAGGTSA
jgi:3-dehydroquinate dehydratase-2